jgi:aldehyde:ferredoxin oxidoreductase
MGSSRSPKRPTPKSVQLRAWRAVLADQVTVCKFSDLEYRMAEIEERLRDPTGHTDRARKVPLELIEDRNSRSR